MTVKSLILPNALATPLIGKFRNGLPRTRRPAYAAWLFGTSYHANATQDMSGNGRHLTHGNPSFPIAPGAYQTDWPHGRYYILPFHFDAPAAAGPVNEMTLVTFGRVTSTAIVYWWQSVGVTAPARQATLQVAATYDAIITVADNLNSYSSTISPAGAYRSSENAMWALSLSHWSKQTAIAHNGVWDFAQGAVPFAEDPGRQVGENSATLPRLMARGDSGGAAGIVNAAGAFVFDYCMTPEELRYFYDRMRAFYARYGYVV